jgi:hypothetical protein
MLCENLSTESPRGAVRFREPSQDRLRDREQRPLLPPVALAADCLRVEVPPPSPRLRGRLAEVLEQAVEQALEGACAPSAGIDASLSRDASLSDQLFRARAVGFRRLELSLGSLERLALSGGAMDPRDTDALVFWVAATRDRPVHLVLDAGTSSLPAYGPTVELGEILLPAMVAPRGSDAPSSARGSTVETSSTTPLPPLDVAPVNDTRVSASEPPPAAEQPAEDSTVESVKQADLIADPVAATLAASPEPAVPSDDENVTPPVVAFDDDTTSADFAELLVAADPPSAPAAIIASPPAAAGSAPAPARPARPKRPRSGLVHLTPRPSAVQEPADRPEAVAVESSPEPPTVAARPSAPHTQSAAPGTTADTELEPDAEDQDDPELDEIVPARVPAARVAMIPPPRQAAPRAPSRIVAPPRLAVAEPDPTPPPPSVTVRRRAPEKRELDAHAELLASSRGPRPLAQVERMFVERYVPLSDAEIHGEADDFQRGARHEWAGSFAKSYADAWSALRVSGKRPQMVMDAPALASATARLHGARAVELFLVDGMRYDLGCMVHDRLRTLVAGLASGADRTLLWSALPSTTASQLDSLARGPEALMGHGVPDDDSVVIRGRAVSVPRRIRVGNREIMKLDLVEARLRELGPPLPERFASLADEIATAIARHIETLPPRTLAFVFGDHGFLIDGTRKSSGPARQGGSSPDEVLVPAFSWLTGGVG